MSETQTFNRDAFHKAEIIASALMTRDPDLPHAADTAEAVRLFRVFEAEARARTGWLGCIFGPDGCCTLPSPAICSSCEKGIRSHPMQVTGRRAETSRDGSPWLFQDVEPIETGDGEL